MNNNDINTWKELLQDLSDTVEQNKVIIREIKEEVELQKQRNKKEVQALSDEIAAQLADLESLLKELDQTELLHCQVI